MIRRFMSWSGYDAPGEGGAKIPVITLRLKSTPKDGSAPVLLYGYGSYGITIP